MPLTAEIEDLIEQNAEDFAISKAFKNAIGEYLGGLHKIFEDKQGKDFMVPHTQRLDAFLSLMYKTLLRRAFGNYIPMRNNIPIALVALGSYAREQLSVYSDIDLMICYEDVEGYNIKPLIEKLLYMAWDAGLKLGHRVHTVDELTEVAKEDITIKTSLIESRFIFGSTFVWQNIQGQILKIRHTDAKLFVLDKMSEAQVRHKKYNRSMQPNIKEGFGGLRDAQLVYWLAKVIYGINNLKELSGQIFSETLYKEYRTSLEFLYRVRTALHLVAGKKQDMLALEFIPEISKRLNIFDQRQLVSKTLQAMHVIARFSYMISHRLSRPYQYEQTNIIRCRSQIIGENIYYDGTFLYHSFKHKMNFSELRDLLIKLPDITFTADAGLIHALHEIKPNELQPHELSLLVRTLLHRNNLFSVLQLLYEVGLVSSLFTPLKRVMFLAQFDGYHEYPVDIHSIKSVKALENIRSDFIKKLYDGFNSTDRALLKLVVLIHDCGKGRRRDHSEVGAKLFSIFAKTLGFSDEQLRVGHLLILNHVVMSSVAFREDFDNERILFGFTSIVKEQKILDMLYVLTYADINAVSHEAYSSFNANMLNELYLHSSEALNNQEMVDEAVKRARKERSLAKLDGFIELNKVTKKKILSIKSNLFFIKFRPSKILKLSLKAKDIEDYKYRIKNESYLNIEIFRRKPLNISYLLNKLSYLNITSMDIFSFFDDIKYFNLTFENTVDNDHIGIVEQIVNDSFDMNSQVELSNVIIKREEIIIDCEHSKSYAKLQLNTSNQEGLLGFAMHRFDESDVEIATAKVHTTKRTARDLFLIEKRGSFCHNPEEIIALLTKQGI